MEILIKKAKIVAPGDKNHLKIRDILISKGKIANIGSSISAPKAKIIESKDLHVSVGWMDIGTHIGEPGLEHRGTIATASRAAANGGFTDLVVMPIVLPVTDSKSQISYIQNNQPTNGTRIHAIGAVSKGAKGDDLTEMMDMAAAGAVAFGDGLRSIQDSGMMIRALQYVKATGRPIINCALDKSIAHEGLVHEGAVSVAMGIQGIPSIAEHTAVLRDSYLAKYTDSQLIVHCISTKESCQMIADAKQNEVQIFSTVPYLNLIHTDDEVKNFDANLKVKPPLRSSADRKALIKGLKSGAITAIVSNHVPLEEELKKLEFSYAAFGAIGLETLFAALHSHINKELDLDTLISALTTGPRAMLTLDQPEIKVDEQACLTLFDPTIEWTYTQSNSKCISTNSPYFNQSFTGKVIGTVIGSQVNI